MQLKPYNTFGIAALSDCWVPIHTIADLQCALSNATYRQQLPLRILGGGSNVLFTTDQLQGCILHNCLRGISIQRQDTDFVWVSAASGEIWHNLVSFALQNNWGGIENLSLIPGTVGAAPVQNIGAYGAELSQVLEEVATINLQTQEPETLTANDCQFAYRDSIFKREAKDRYFITAVTLRLRRQPLINLQYGDIRRTLEAMQVADPTIQTVSEAICRIRRSKLPDPAKLGNGGSFFKNPEVQRSVYTALQTLFPTMPAYPLPDNRVKIPAAWLIEQCGWRGKRLGDAGVHEHHALVLVNYGNAKGSEINQLAQHISADVWQKFGIEIVPEINIWA